MHELSTVIALSRSSDHILIKNGVYLVTPTLLINFCSFIASKYADSLLNSAHEYFKNTEKLEDFVHTVYMELIVKH